MAKKVLLATNNAHKAEEIRHALSIDGWEFVTLADAGVVSDPVEDADSFEGNARIKALAAHNAGSCAALADDSGLEVDALGGNPGVRSARYAGDDATDEQNNNKLLADLEDVADASRTARFRCVLCFIDEDGTEVIAEGAVEGIIGKEPRGEDGFGYDPLFFPNEYRGEKTFAEVSEEEKTRISHRGRALEELKRQLVSGVSVIQ